MRLAALVGDAYGGWGGIAKFNRDFVGALSSHPAAPEIVVCPRRIEGPLGVVPERVEVRARAARGGGRFVAEVVRVALEGRPAVVFCGHINLAPVAWAWARSQGAPVVLIVHGIDAWRPSRRAAVNAAARRMDGVIAVSRFTQERFGSWAHSDRSARFILPNCVDAERFGPGHRPADLVDRYGLAGRTVLMTLARLEASERYKGIEEVMAILPRLAVSIPNLSYLVAGDGNDRERLEGEARRLGVADRVVFSGRVSEERKADHYRLADAFVMPGRGEGFGIVYLEALACGVPVVGSRLDGSRDALLDGRLGALVDPRDPDDILRGIGEALARPKGVIPRELSEFSPSRYEQRVHAILDATLAGRRAGS